MEKFHKTIFDAKEAIIYNKIDEAITIIRSHIDNEHGVDSDFSRLGLYVHAHRVYFERAKKYLEVYGTEKKEEYKKMANHELDKAQETILAIYELINKLRRDLVVEE